MFPIHHHNRNQDHVNVNVNVNGDGDKYNDKTNMNMNDLNISSALYFRSTYTCHQSQYLHISNYFGSYVSRDQIAFLSNLRIVSPHSSQITSLDMDNNSEGRFLLCGSSDSTISIYDLSLLGSEYHLEYGHSYEHREEEQNHENHVKNQVLARSKNSDVKSISVSHNDDKEKQKNKFRHIGKSQRSHANPSQTIAAMQRDPNYLPSGHCCPVTQVQWYPIDSGIFLSSDCIGNIMLWDTNAFTPATCMSLSKSDFYTAGSSSSTSSSSCCRINCMDLPKNSTHHMQLAVGCVETNKLMSRGGSNALSLVDDRAVYLCDLKSCSTSQQLIGHGSGNGTLGKPGISTVQWSPVDEFILCSGGGDGCIKLWDIRKSGSSACLTTLDQEMKANSDMVLQYSNVNKGKIIRRHHRNGNTNTNKRRKISTITAPGNYSKVQCSANIQSHAGPIVSLSFTPNGESIISASPTDGLHLWNIQKGCNNFGVLQPTTFWGTGTDNLRHPIRKRKSTVPMLITQPTSRKTATMWLGTDDLLGYDLNGMGGRPNKVLSGHLGTVTAITSQDNSMRLFTGGSDGMLLAWGYESS